MMRYKYLAKVLRDVVTLLTPEGAWCHEGCWGPNGEKAWAPERMTVRRDVWGALTTALPLDCYHVSDTVRDLTFRYLSDFRHDIEPGAPDFWKPAETVTQEEMVGALSRAADLAERLDAMDGMLVFFPSTIRHLPDLKTHAERLALIEESRKEKSDAP
jgi:hypothetical protein